MTGIPAVREPCWDTLGPTSANGVLLHPSHTQVMVKQRAAKGRNDAEQPQLPLPHARASLENFTREIMFMLQRSEQKASHFPALPFKLNPSFPDMAPFGIHPLNLFWISAAASGSGAWNPLDLFIKAPVGLGFVPAVGTFLPVV